jgi:hypothetical protein
MIPFNPSLLNPLLMVVPVGMWSKAQPVGEADRPHIHVTVHTLAVRRRQEGADG